MPVRAPKPYTVDRSNRTHSWCSCGALIRGGKCVSSTCGKTQ